MDQAERLRSMVRGSENRARVLSIASGKGGVGKTNIAVNLAITLARMGKRVILVDVDIGLANADVLLGVQPKLHLGHVLSGEIPALEALVPTVTEGLLLMPGCTGVRYLSDLDSREREYLVRTFQELEAYADVVVIDTGAGISKNVVQFAAATDEVLVVTIPEPTAIADGYALVKAVSREKGFGRIRLVVNQALSPADAHRVSERVRTVSRRFLGIEVDDLGYVLADSKVSLSVRRKRAFVLDAPRSPASCCIRAMAERLLGEKRAAENKGFLRRLARAINGVVG